MNKITPADIFAKNQVLTLAIARELCAMPGLPPMIAITSPEYSGNQCHVTISRVNEVISEWGWADLQTYGSGTRQDDWKRFMTPEQIDECKTKLILLDENRRKMAVCHTKYYNFYGDCPTFTGSDADREVYYILIDDVS